MAQLSNLVVLLKSSRISVLDARVYLGGIELLERREIAKRVRALGGDRPEKLSRFSIQELVSVVPETTFARVRRALKRLESAGALSFASHRIETTRTGLFPEEPLSVELKKRGALSRLVPVPRRLLAELCRETRKSVLLTKLAYVIRGLTLDRESGELRSRGCVKASWIAQHFGLSIRSVRLARSSLIQSGFIGKDRSSFQRKLNRDGSYFEIDLSRYAGTLAAEKSRESDSLETVPAHSEHGSAGTLPSGQIQQDQVAEIDRARRCFVPAGIAPPEPPNRTRIAPPRERQETPYGLKNQKTECSSFSPRASTPGVRGTETRTVNLKNIQLEDLRRLSSLRILYEQTVAAKWISRSEADFQNFVAAAVRVTRLAPDALRTDPVRVFVGIVKKRLWHHVTAAQEERAREVISKHRHDPVTFRNSALGDDRARSTVEQLLKAIANRHCVTMPESSETDDKEIISEQKKLLAATTPLRLSDSKSGVSNATKAGMMLC